MVGRIALVALTTTLLASCQREMNDGAKCPAGTSLKRESPSNPPATVEYCVRDDGTMHGPYLATIEGDPLKRGQCENGQPSGTWTTYNPNGTKQRVAPYVNGKVDGFFALYGSDGKELRSGTCKQGVPVGTWHDSGRNKFGTYDQSGKLVSGDDMGTSECATNSNPCVKR